MRLTFLFSILGIGVAPRLFKQKLFLRIIHGTHTRFDFFQNQYVKCTHVYSASQVQEAGLNVLRDKLLGTTRMSPTVSYSLVHSRLEQTQLARNTFFLHTQFGFGCCLELFNELKVLRVLEPILFIAFYFVWF